MISLPFFPTFSACGFARIASIAACGATAFFMQAAPVTAQELAYDDAPTETCLRSSYTLADRRACIGRSTRACIDGTEGGYTTYSAGGCVSRELAFWDAELNANYADAREQAEARDAGGYGGPGVWPALRQMQRTWIPFRDAACAFERSQWANGTGGGPAQLNCLMRLTADQALYLADVWVGE